MDRYDYNNQTKRLHTSPSGVWVKHSDAKQEITTLQARVMEFEELLRRSYQDLYAVDTQCTCQKCSECLEFERIRELRESINNALKGTT